MVKYRNEPNMLGQLTFEMLFERLSLKLITPIKFDWGFLFVLKGFDGP